MGRRSLLDDDRCKPGALCSLLLLREEVSPERGTDPSRSRSRSRNVGPPDGGPASGGAAANAARRSRLAPPDAPPPQPKRMPRAARALAFGDECKAPWRRSGAAERPAEAQARREECPEVPEGKAAPPWEAPALKARVPLAKAPARRAKAKAQQGPPRARGSVALCAGGMPEAASVAEVRWAQGVLARHVARLGVGAGERLQDAVKAAVEVNAAQGRPGCWEFLLSDEGLEAFHVERRRFEGLYDRHGRGPTGDREVRAAVAEGPTPPSWALELPPAPATLRPVPPGETDWTPAEPPGSELELPTHEVRFAHDDQSELFTHNHHDTQSSSSVLQLVVELTAGLILPEEVPPFTVCRHQGRWYCRSGNRRLAALRLAQRLAPARFGFVRVKAVNVDKIFLQGAPGKRAKLTTQRNGEDCEGRWLFIRETGEVVGSGHGDPAEYGADLLALLPLPGGARRGSPANGRRRRPARDGDGGDDADDDADVAAGGA